MSYFSCAMINVCSCSRNTVIQVQEIHLFRSKKYFKMNTIIYSNAIIPSSSGTLSYSSNYKFQPGSFVTSFLLRSCKKFAAIMFKSWYLEKLMSSIKQLNSSAYIMTSVSSNLNSDLDLKNGSNH